ncbi:DUF5131 family protein [Anabaena catenula]|uniref:DUF5131 family protein n=1 Tax=Anabaena catenula TaxID=1296320 RepID=UPI001F54E506|nr:DUF5131 family protein [Anabaena catenula]
MIIKDLIKHLNIEWVRDIREQCIEANVPFFFKQWGGVQKKKFGRELDGRTWDEFPKSADSKNKVSALALK